MRRLTLLGLMALVLGVSLSLSACTSSARQTGHSMAEWKEAGLVFVADNRHASVRVLRTSGAEGLPVMMKTLDVPVRDGVIGLRVDDEGHLYVLSVTGVAVYDAKSLVLQETLQTAKGVSFEAFQSNSGLVRSSDGRLWQVSQGKLRLSRMPRQMATHEQES